VPLTFGRLRCLWDGVCLAANVDRTWTWRDERLDVLIIPSQQVKEKYGMEDPKIPILVKLAWTSVGLLTNR
jgi:hypothetical protein